MCGGSHDNETERLSISITVKLLGADGGTGKFTYAGEKVGGRSR